MSKNVVILVDFEDCIRPDEVKFDRLHLWAMIPNLRYNLRDDSWAKLIAQQIDKHATSDRFDLVGGFLRARVSIDVSKPD